jgi:hypothetical protein
MITQSEEAALNRAIAAARANPLVALALTPAKLAEAEARIRHAAREGMTRAEATRIHAALDTPEERADVRTKATALLGKSDAEVIAWATHRLMKAAFLTQPAKPVPAVTITAAQRMLRAMCFMAAPTFNWAAQPNVDEILDAILASGIDGPSMELGGMYAVHEYNGKPTKRDIGEIYDEQIEALEPWVAGCRVRELMIHLVCSNTNQKQIDKRTDAYWRERMRQLALRYGYQNILYLPASETDKRMRATAREAFASGLRAGGVPKSHLIGYGSAKWGAYHETHKQRGQVPRGGRFTISVNDNAPGIKDVYGPKWQSGGEPIPANITDLGREYREKKVSGALFSFGLEFDFIGLDALAKGWGAVATGNPVTGNGDAIDISNVRNLGTHSNIKVQKLPVTKMLRRAYIKGRSMYFDYDKTGWKPKDGELAVRNYLFWRQGNEIVGGMFEWSQDGREARGLKNVFDGYLSKMQPPSGTKVWACIADCPTDRTATQRSNVVDAGLWP